MVGGDPIAHVLRDPSKVFTDYAMIPPSYLVFKHGDRYYAKCGLPEKAGLIEFSGGDASEVVQTVINNLPDVGGSIVFGHGQFEFYSTVEISGKKILIRGQGRATVLHSNMADHSAIFKFTGQNENVIVEKLTFLTKTTDRAIEIHGIMAFSRFSELSMYNEPKNVTGFGILVDLGASEYIMLNTFENIDIHNYGSGITIMTNASDAFANVNRFKNIEVYNAYIGFDLNAGSAGYEYGINSNALVDCLVETGVENSYGYRLRGGEGNGNNNLRNCYTLWYGTTTKTTRCEITSTYINTLILGGNLRTSPYPLIDNGENTMIFDKEYLVHRGGIATKIDVDDYGGNFTNYTPSPEVEGIIILAVDTNSTNPGQRLYAYMNGEWRYVDLT